ncbi:hypothetical protein PsalN5692_00639 [Piscirickettsia salmonis]|uniref:hypothetical protein n=1 Tax=Piscirickettsia salmonis TaxID=1238 RepID=UPI0012B7B31A|nr:hypothetical protein [Piscirickettsia salmonis]QGP49217.1 hypothetical protein PsalN5692_00639 [Piscirickettsia salmonis]
MAVPVVNDVVQEKFYDFCPMVGSRDKLLNFLNYDDINQIDYSWLIGGKSKKVEPKAYSQYKANLAEIANHINKIYYLKSEQEKGNNNGVELKQEQEKMKANLSNYKKRIEEAYFSTYSSKTDNPLYRGLQPYAEWLAMELDILLNSNNKQSCLVPFVDPRDSANAAVCNNTIFSSDINSIINLHNTDKIGLVAQGRAPRLKAMLADELQERLVNNVGDWYGSKKSDSKWAKEFGNWWAQDKKAAIEKAIKYLKGDKTVKFSDKDKKQLNDGETKKIIAKYAPDLSKFKKLIEKPVKKSKSSSWSVSSLFQVSSDNHLSSSQNEHTRVDTLDM